MNPNKKNITEVPIYPKLDTPLTLSKIPQAFIFSLEGGEEYNSEGINPEFILTGTLDLPPNNTPKDLVVIFYFLDEKNEIIYLKRVVGLSFSKNVGLFSYLNQDSETGDFSVSFEQPQNVAKVVCLFRTWNLKPPSIAKLLPGIKLSPYKIMESFSNEFQEFENKINSTKSDKLVFMFSGTTFIQDIRANRPIRLTKVLLNQNIPVIFNYHRFTKTISAPEYQGDLLLQIPIDVTKRVLRKIANIKTNKKKIFIVSYPHPTIPKILNYFKTKGWVNIYDARDDWEEFEKVGSAKWYVPSNEKYIVRNCDYVTAVSWPLAMKLESYNPIENVKVVPNALDPNFLSKKIINSKVKKKKIIGYFGHLSPNWFDWESLIEISKNRPDYTFEIIGHSPPGNLNPPDNIKLLGPKTHPEINLISQKWSVAIIPFKMGALADAVDPIKIYEYLALNLPVVSFKMPQIDSYPYTVTVSTIEEFCSSLDKFIEITTDKKITQDWLKCNKWSDRVNEYLELSTQSQNDGLLNINEHKK